MNAHTRLLSLFLILIACSSARAATLTLQQFQEKMRAQVSALSKTTVAGVSIEVLGSQQALFANQETTRLVPASASKVITTSAALEKLGSKFSFTTQVLLNGTDVILMGSGDPNLLSENLWSIAKEVAATGLKHITSVKINNSNFAEDYTGLHTFPGSADDAGAGIVSATNLNYNAVQILITPSPKGTTPIIDIGPRHNLYGIVRSTVKQVAGSKTNISVKSLGMLIDKEIFQVSGTIGKSAKVDTEYLPAGNPEAHIAYAFAGNLRDLGVTVDTDFGGATFAPLTPGGKMLATYHSYPLNFLATLYMPPSNNYMAEQVFEAIGPAYFGGAASNAKSQQAAHQFFQARTACQTSSMDNGSGLTFENHIAPQCFVETMQSLYKEGLAYTDLINSFPVGGKTGTLKTRFTHNGKGFKAGLVKAKTGTLWSEKVATALIGITPISSGQTVVFALIENDSRTQESLLHDLKVWEDKCVEIMQQLKL
jgi:serine-type D-Ala-D-Ala carboxypeptidase/endopeptidase (penicillin-binding protein 4)